MDHQEHSNAGMPQTFQRLRGKYQDKSSTALSKRSEGRFSDRRKPFGSDEQGILKSTDKSRSAISVPRPGAGYNSTGKRGVIDTPFEYYF